MPLKVIFFILFGITLIIPNFTYAAANCSCNVKIIDKITTDSKCQIDVLKELEMNKTITVQNLLDSIPLDASCDSTGNITNNKILMAEVLNKTSADCDYKSAEITASYEYNISCHGVSLEPVKVKDGCYCSGAVVDQPKDTDKIEQIEGGLTINQKFCNAVYKTKKVGEKDVEMCFWYENDVLVQKWPKSIDSTKCKVSPAAESLCWNDEDPTECNSPCYKSVDGCVLNESEAKSACEGIETFDECNKKEQGLCEWQIDGCYCTDVEGAVLSGLSRIKDLKSSGLPQEQCTSCQNVVNNKQCFWFVKSETISQVTQEQCFPKKGADSFQPIPFSIPPVDTLNKLGSTDINIIIGRVIKAIMGIMGSIALAMFVYSGILWMTAAGNSEKEEKSKTILVWSTLGVVVVFASYALLNFVFEILK